MQVRSNGQGSNRAALGVATPCLVFAAVLAYFGLFVGYGLNLDDEGVLLAQYLRTYNGEVPVLDFHIGYTPGGYYLNAAWFYLFGPSVISLRWGLAASNALVASLLFAVGRRVLPASFALIPALLYCAVIPFYAGQFATFNIPYPAWYGVSLWMLGLWAQLRFLDQRRVGFLILSGLAAGLCFSVKPNVGLFQLAMNGLLFLVLFEPPQPPVSQPIGSIKSASSARADSVAWWALLFGVTGGLAVVFASRAGLREFGIFLLPLAIALGCLGWRRGAGRTGDDARPGLLRDGLIFAAAFLAPILPWVIGFLDLLGAQHFVRALFFVGSGFEHYYYETFHEAGLADLGLLLAVAGLAVVAFFARTAILHPRRLLVGTVTLLVAAVVLISLAPMPQGLHAAVVSASEDLSFTASLVVHWLALGMVASTLLQADSNRQQKVELALLLGALTMYLQLYPRSDFPHLIFAMPLTLVVAMGLLRRFVEALPEAFAVRALSGAILIGGLLGFVGFRIAPNLNSVLFQKQALLGLERAPISLERGREPRLRSLGDTARYLQVNLAADETTFTFPAIEVLSFLSDRVNATRHGYFFPGWPGHEVEAEVIEALQAAPPRLIVALSDHQFFFSTAPLYYYALREFIVANYEEVERFGVYSVLAHNSVDPTTLQRPDDSGVPLGQGLKDDFEQRLVSKDEAVLLAALGELKGERLSFAWKPVTSLLFHESIRVRRAAVEALAAADSPDVALALARALEAGQVPQSKRLRAIRQVWTTGDPRVLGSVARIFRNAAGTPEYGPLMAALDANAAKLVFSHYWMGKPLPAEVAVADFPVDPFWRERLADPNENIIFRTLLAGLLSRVDGQASVPALREAAASDRAYLRGAAIEGLLYVGVEDRREQLFDSLVTAAAEEATYSPSMILKLYREDPAVFGPRLLAALVGASGQGSELERTLTWVAAATADPQFADSYRQAFQSQDSQLRMAALAGLVRIGGERLPEILELAAEDADYEVRIFAARNRD